MSISSDTSRENLTLSESDLAACRPVVAEGGHVVRALCPFHGSDRQRSLRVQVHSGRFVCFACGAWGYMDTAREQWREEHQRPAAAVVRIDPHLEWNRPLRVVGAARLLGFYRRVSGCSTLDEEAELAAKRMRVK